jgi:Berberine and berberine like
LLAKFTERRLPGQSRELDFTPWAAPIAARVRTRPPSSIGASLFSLKQTAIVDSDSSKATKDAAQRWLRQSWQTVRPWGSGRVFPNFPDPDLEDWGHAYYGPNYERLVRIKRAYDPDDVFRFRQSLSSRIRQRGRPPS